jgi:hypothetical protein
VVSQFVQLFCEQSLLRFQTKNLLIYWGFQVVCMKLMDNSRQQFHVSMIRSTAGHCKRVNRFENTLQLYWGPRIKKFVNDRSALCSCTGKFVVCKFLLKTCHAIHPTKTAVMWNGMINIRTFKHGQFIVGFSWLKFMIRVS